MRVPVLNVGPRQAGREKGANVIDVPLCPERDPDHWAIGLLESSDEIWAKLRPAVTDPKRIKRTDPGTPEVCNIYHLHKAFSPPATVEHVAVQCSTAGWGCIDCKKVLAESMESELVPIRARAAALRDDTAGVDGALAAGADRCRTLARETMRGVRERMGFD